MTLRSRFFDAARAERSLPRAQRSGGGHDLRHAVRDSARPGGSHLRTDVAPCRVVRPWLLALLVLVGCASGGTNGRALHVVDGTLVVSRPVSSTAYEVYLRARLALAANPPDLVQAQESIELALELDPRDPQLWTTQAEIAARARDDERAFAAARRALVLAPDYPPARKLLAELEGGEPSAALTRGP